MSKYSFVVCFNALENRYFKVSAVHEVEHLYRLNFYRLSLRLNFNECDVNLSQFEKMRQLCFRKITKLMTTQNMWQSHHSFYVINCEIRTIRKNNELDQQNNDISEGRASESENASSDETESSTSNDSAYNSPPSVAMTDADVNNSNSSASSAYSSGSD
ncbi:hypothetical protein PVAND_005856 [Polypedilum vanderplanki]|uniref:Uncharacterized protein n=1 Tax=Polypedilum vanderplanki TaxID=319348 RepID=A0A9J6C1D4_POLVA|nr:hypothetical protein PVAND_005856 [Polypedilum vanderplanki]